jgi:hypothetical protein
MSETNSVERTVRRVRINAGEPIMQDHGFTRWPMSAGGPVDPDTVFDAEWNGRYWDCRADGHGRRTWLNEPGGYGNGSIFVSNLEGVTVLDDAPNFNSPATKP